MRYYPMHLSHQVYALLILVYGEYFRNPGGHSMGILQKYVTGKHKINNGVIT